VCTGLNSVRLGLGVLWPPACVDSQLALCHTARTQEGRDCVLVHKHHAVTWSQPIPLIETLCPSIWRASAVDGEVNIPYMMFWYLSSKLTHSVAIRTLTLSDLSWGLREGKEVVPGGWVQRECDCGEQASWGGRAFLSPSPPLGICPWAGF